MAQQQLLDDMLEQMFREQENDPIEVTDRFDGMGRLLTRVRRCASFTVTDRCDEHGVRTARSMSFHRPPTSAPRIADLLTAPASPASLANPAPQPPHNPVARLARRAQPTRASRRAPNRAIAALPRKKFIEYAKAKVEHDTEYHICLGDYEPEEKLIELPCGHVYHNTCGIRWLKQSKTCPKCRAAVEG